MMQYFGIWNCFTFHVFLRMERNIFISKHPTKIKPLYNYNLVTGPKQYYIYTYISTVWLPINEQIYFGFVNLGFLFIYIIWQISLVETLAMCICVWKMLELHGGKVNLAIIRRLDYPLGLSPNLATPWNPVNTMLPQPSLQPHIQLRK